MCQWHKAHCVDFLLWREGMLCYFVVIDTVELIMNECLIWHIEITKFFYVLVNVSPKWVFILLLMRLFWCMLFCYFGPYPYCWDGWWIILYSFVMYKKCHFFIVVNLILNNTTRSKHVNSCINKYWFQLTPTVCVFSYTILVEEFWGLMSCGLLKLAPHDGLFSSTKECALEAK